MKKKIIFSSLILILIASITLFINKDKIFINKQFEETVKYAITVDGTSSENFPSYGDYDVSVTCDNASAVWDNKINGVKFNSISAPSECNIAFTTRSAGTTFSNYIINTLYANTPGNNGIYYTNNAEYRYTGKFPNNYVWYNDELWRIIGVFDSNSHGQSGENLVKIIRDDTLPLIAWDSGNDNSWKDSDSASLSTMLNTYYYNGTNGSSDVGCYISGSGKTDCDYTLTGLDAEARNMVQSVTWYLGAYSTSAVSATAMYGYERSSTVSSGSSATTTANIGLMYASDYGYAAEYSCWNANTNLSSYNTASCGGTNWLLKNQYEWTITARSDSATDVFYVAYRGNVDNSGYAYYGYAPRPSLYLNSSVERVAGTGAKADPFIIR